MARAPLLTSSPRKRGPITTVVCWTRSRRPPCKKCGAAAYGSLLSQGRRRVCAFVLDKHTFAISPHVSREFWPVRPALSIRGRRESRVPIAPVGPVQKKHGGRTTGSTGNIRLSLRDGVTAYFALSPVTGLFCHRRRWKRVSTDLNASIGASGPHDFAVRIAPARPSRAHCVHRISPQRS
jgi:hypothetical protein